MNRRDLKLTDAAVDALPLHHGRTELLEEIMNSPALDDASLPSTESRRPSRYLVPLAAAAVVAALATGPLWWASGSDDSGADSDQVAAAPPVDAAGADFPLLASAGWRIEDADSDEYGVEVEFAGPGGTSFQANSRAADLYDEYVADREDIVDPPAPGDPAEVAGLPGQLWSYSAQDHTVIREVGDDRYWEFRGEGMRLPAFANLLAEVRLVGLEEFENSLPPEFTTSAERPAAIQGIVDGITAALAPDHPLVPAGTPSPDFDTQAYETYGLGADVAGPVACAWLESYVSAVASGDDDLAQDAVDALATTRQWPILREMKAQGDYPEVIWEYADAIAANRPIEGFPQGLGCP